MKVFQGIRIQRKWCHVDETVYARQMTAEEQGANEKQMREEAAQSWEDQDPLNAKEIGGWEPQNLLIGLLDRP